MRLTLIAIALLPATLATHSHAQEYPNRVVRLIVPYLPGGATDIMARILAARMTESFKQQVIVDNRGGGASITGTELVARAAPDGYTLLLGNIALGANPSLFRKLPYDAERDLAPVSLVAVMPTILVAHPSLPVRNVKEFIAFAKQAKNASWRWARNPSAQHRRTGRRF